MKIATRFKFFLVLPLLHVYVGWGLLATDMALWVLLAGLLLYYPIGQLGQGAGYHRLFAHKSFKPKPWFPYVATFLSSISFVGDPLSYTVVHRLHHRFSDTERDPHSPIKGRFHAYVGWVWNFSPKPRDSLLAADLIRDYPWIPVFRRYEPALPWLVHGALACISLELSLAVLIGCLVSLHVSLAINAFSHNPQQAEESGATDSKVLARWVSPTFLHRHHHAQGAALADYSLDGVRDWIAPVIRRFLSI